MTNQESVHLKLDRVNYAWLQQYVFRTGIARNRLINIAVARYVKTEQARQRMEDAGKLREWIEAARIAGIYTREQAEAAKGVNMFPGEGEGCSACGFWNPDEEQCDYPDMPPCYDEGV